MLHQCYLKRGKKRLLLPWLDAIKIALIQEQYEELAHLCEEIPHFDTKEQAIEAQALITQAISSMREEQKSMKETMAKIRKNIAFLSRENREPRLSTLS